MYDSVIYEHQHFVQLGVLDIFFHILFYFVCCIFIWSIINDTQRDNRRASGTERASLEVTECGLE